MKEPLILASASPRRRELFSLISIPFEVIPPKISEELLPGESPWDHAVRLAKAKAKDVSRLFPHRWVIGADTIVFLDKKILGKPVDEEDAKRMLQFISSRIHKVVTGYVIINEELRKEISSWVESEVKIKNLSKKEIENYVATGEPMDKAGSYGIQGIGAFMVKEIKGSYTNVVGLPLCEVIDSLKDIGAITEFPIVKKG